MGTAQQVLFSQRSHLQDKMDAERTIPGAIQSLEKARAHLEVVRTSSVTLTGFSRRQVRSTTETLGVGTRKAIPVSFLLET